MKVTTALVALLLLFIFMREVAAEGHYEQYGNQYSRSKAESYYDRNGGYKGRKDRNGSLYNKYGDYIGREDKNGGIYNRNGRYLGRKDGQR